MSYPPPPQPPGGNAPGPYEYGGVPAGPTPEEKNWALAAHVGVFVAVWIAMGFLAPLIVMLVKGNDSAFVRRHSVESLNFQISILIYAVAAFLITLVTFGLEEDAEVSPEALEVTPEGSRFRAAGIELETPLRGRFNVENVLGAVAAGILLDLDEEHIAAGIGAVDGIPGRLELIDEGQPFGVLVDFAHTPASLDTVLRAARELTEGRVIVVFGAGGDRDHGKRPLMGRVAAGLARR